MPDRKLEASPYRKLVTEIACLYEGVRKALVEAYWKIGQRIVEVEQQGAIKAAYGIQLLIKLSEDLSKQCGPGFSLSNLKRMRQFYLFHPKSPPSGELNWSQYAELLPIGDTAKRKRFIQKALREELGSRDIRALVRHELVREAVAENLAKGPEKLAAVVELLKVPKLGPLNTYSIVDSGDVAWPEKDVLLFDHGFKGYRTLTSAEKHGLKAGDVVEWTGVKLLKVQGATKPGYTYKAFLKEVIDGDTLWVVLNAGMREVRREKLRLRGIDCPELNTVEGQKAKKFVEKVLEGVPSLTVLSSKNATYDRYEADVFYNDKDGKETYLNNLLLEKGYAVRMAK